MEILKRIEVPVFFSILAENQAREWYAEQEAEDFSGDWVGTLDPTPYAKFLRYLQAPPSYRVAQRGRAEVLVTSGVDRHVDDISGLTLAVCLYNSGLTVAEYTESGEVSYFTPRVGDRFVFDDRKAHEAEGGIDALVLVTVPLEEA